MPAFMTSLKKNGLAIKLSVRDMASYSTQGSKTMVSSLSMGLQRSGTSLHGSSKGERDSLKSFSMSHMKTSISSTSHLRDEM